MKLYAGIDLHSNNIFLSILNEEEKEVFCKQISLNTDLIINTLLPFKSDLQGVVVESTFNWYWLADTLQTHGYQVYLAHPAANQQYDGYKHTNDKTDARWLARLLQLGILRTGYIYPKEQRGLRELLRKRMRLVQLQTTIVLGLQALIMRYEGNKISAHKIKTMKEEDVNKHIKDPNIVFLFKQKLIILKSFLTQIHVIEQETLKQLKQLSGFKELKQIPGIGDVISGLIILESGDIKRFKSAGNYCSYCRCVSSERKSNGKKKGENNRKNGNHYLCWAFIEGANFAIRYNEDIKKYYQRKMKRSNKIIAIKTIAAKLSKACFFVLRDGVEFDMKIFNR
ncbi:IS110 family transposase [Candidatus Woesearchaeota archaeon]|nr:IS110 family transposase [Candidatus Woesearchaeota archaeon]